MIKNIHNKKVTPKTKAQDILADGISIAISYWTENTNNDADQMTEREQALVQEQLDKIADRLAKKLGYEKAWHS